MPQMGSTLVQDVAEGQGVRRQGEEASRRTKKRNQPSRGTNQAEEPEEKARGMTRIWGRLDLGWRVS